MNKIHLCVLPLALILAASSGYSVAGEPRGETDPKCEGDPQAPMVNINIKGKIKKTECVRARLGETIVFRLTPKKNLELNSVEIVPKDAFKDSWLQGKNDVVDDIIIIKVPGVYDPKKKREYSDHYFIVVVNGQEIDPRVEVER